MTFALPSPVDGDVAIAVATYRRNLDLEILLPHLRREANAITPAAKILIVDNDPDAGAAPLVEGENVRYYHEPAPGIAAARNRALDEADRCRFVVFIDDDEHPEPGWLSALLRTAARTGAAAVAGPVISRFEGTPDEWILASGLFDRRRMPTGTAISAAATNNLLLDLAQTRPLRFDDRLGLIGGSDNLFTRTLALAGKPMTWCDEALVIDRVPAARLTREWVLRRAYRVGNSEVTVSLLLATSPLQRLRVRLVAIAQGTVRLILGAAQVWYGLLSGRLGPRARGRRIVSRGRGKVSGALGVRYAEYLRESSPRRGRKRKK